jgi:hypothetical protein
MSIDNMLEQIKGKTIKDIQVSSYRNEILFETSDGVTVAIEAAQENSEGWITPENLKFIIRYGFMV